MEKACDRFTYVGAFKAQTCQFFGITKYKDSLLPGKFDKEIFYLHIFCDVYGEISISVNQLMLENKWQLISITRRDPPLTHLLFADDALLFCSALEEQM
ncbi:hypothetical protein CR513_08089, partial [Mucuna pruriens]